MDTLIRIFTDLGINESIFLMFPLIILTFLLLKYQLFLPLRRVMAEREKIASDADKEAGEKQSLVEQKSNDLEAELRKARKEAFALREKTKEDAESRGNGLIVEARQRSAEELERVQRELEPTVEQARTRLQSEASALAALIADRILSGQAGSRQEGT